MNSRVISFEPPGPKARAFMESTADVRVLMGPVGSAKSSTAVMTILMLSALQPIGPDGKRRSRWAVIRPTYRDLVGATIKTWQSWQPRDFGRVTMGSPIVHNISTSDLEIEVLFFPLDRPEDAEKLRSFEFTGVWFDEVSEVPFEIIQAALGRVGRYPSVRDGGCYWSGLLLTSNMTDPDHWVHEKLMSCPKSWEFFIQPGGMEPDAENVNNLPRGYYQRLLDSNDEDWCRRFVHAQFVAQRIGKVVYPAFRDTFHVPQNDVIPAPNLGVVLGIDFGLTPAVAFIQQQADGRVVVFDELVATDAGISRFAKTLDTYWKQHYAHLTVIGAYGDPAGSARSTDTERTAFDVLNANTPWRWRPARTNEITLRTEAVTFFLEKAVDGYPGFQLSPKCKTLRGGFNGKYCFQPVQSGNGTHFHDTPTKNMYSHIQDALQYGVLGLGGAELAVGKERRQGSRIRQAADVDYPLLGDDRPPERNPMQVGVRWGEPSRETYRNERESRPSVARSTDYDIFD